MKLDVPYRRVASLDPDARRALDAAVERLRPLFDAPERAAWRTVAERMRHVGAPDAARPADVAYRKMRPRGYLQLCVVNDESPWSPWALPVPAGVAPAAELARDVAAPVETLCRALYGPGLLHFCVFAVLAPGGEVPTHRDLPHDVNKKRYSHHLHVPIAGADGGELTVGDVTFRLDEGGVYEIDNMAPHSARNAGRGYRVNLMVDFCPAASLALRAAPSPRPPPRAPTASPSPPPRRRSRSGRRRSR